MSYSGLEFIDVKLGDRDVLLKTGGNLYYELVPFRFDRVALVVSRCPTGIE